MGTLNSYAVYTMMDDKSNIFLCFLKEKKHGLWYGWQTYLQVSVSQAQLHSDQLIIGTEHHLPFIFVKWMFAEEAKEVLLYSRYCGTDAGLTGKHKTLHQLCWGKHPILKSMSSHPNPTIFRFVWFILCKNNLHNDKKTQQSLNEPVISLYL